MWPADCLPFSSCMREVMLHCAADVGVHHAYERRPLEHATLPRLVTVGMDPRHDAIAAIDIL